jgi:hypothetical protein
MNMEVPTYSYLPSRAFFKRYLYRLLILLAVAIVPLLIVAFVKVVWLTYQIILIALAVFCSDIIIRRYAFSNYEASQDAVSKLTSTIFESQSHLQTVEKMEVRAEQKNAQLDLAIERLEQMTHDLEQSDQTKKELDRALELLRSVRDQTDKIDRRMEMLKAMSGLIKIKIGDMLYLTSSPVSDAFIEKVDELDMNIEEGKNEVSRLSETLRKSDLPD